MDFFPARLGLKAPEYHRLYKVLVDSKAITRLHNPYLSLGVWIMSSAKDKDSGLTQERLKELFDYDPETGVLTRRISIGRSRAFKGMEAGFPQSRFGRSKDYLMVNVDHHIYNRRFYVHRLIWLYMTGEWPEDQVDHIDGNPSNNKWSNLRGVTNGQNRRNTRPSKRSLTGIKGVRFNERSKKYNVVISLGEFDTLEEATAVRNKAEELFWGDFRSRHTRFNGKDEEGAVAPSD